MPCSPNLVSRVLPDTDVPIPSALGKEIRLWRVWNLNIKIPTGDVIGVNQHLTLWPCESISFLKAFSKGSVAGWLVEVFSVSDRVLPKQSTYKR